MTNPTRGSLISEVMASDKTSLMASSTRRIRSALILVPPRTPIRRSTRAPWGKRASSIRPHPVGRLLAASRAIASANATASVERCQVSWWATSATDAPIRSRRWAFTRFSSARLAFSEPDSGKCRWTRMSTTNAGSSTD